MRCLGKDILPRQMTRESEFLLRCFSLVELLHVDNFVVTKSWGERKGRGDLNLGSRYKGDMAMLISDKALY